MASINTIVRRVIRMSGEKEKWQGQGKMEGNKVTAEKQGKTVIKALALGAHWAGGGPCAVDVKDGKVVRIRPLRYDWKYPKEGIKTWKFERNGKILEPLMKSLPAPFSLAYRKRVYSPNRIKYPLKRVDWDPNGERHPENRGRSKFKRISWDEATDIVAGEIRRIHEKYGPLAILAQGDGHGECKGVQGTHGCQTMLLDKMGGFTQQVRNPDSWEGWYWGAKHVWGDGIVGLMGPGSNVMKDITENTEMLLGWGCDPETTCWGFTGQFASRLLYYWSDIGIKQVYICPDLNYSAAVHADKWIPVLPNTDAALQLAIAYIWITEGTYDKDYVATHTVGFDKFEKYVLGKEDGVPKTPAWASKKCGVPEWTIKALAREFANKTTSIGHYYGGSYIRGPYSHEPARLEVILLAMRGLGKPGVHQCQVSHLGMPRNATQPWRGGLPYFVTGDWKEMRATFRTTLAAWGKQQIPKTLIHKAILNPGLSWWCRSGILSPVEDQFVKYKYPIPKEEGGTEIHMIWTDTPCRTTCWNGGNETIEALRNPKIECIVAQHAWLENDVLFADIILPVNTTLEEEDIMTNVREGVQFYSAAFQEQAIKPIAESKSDFETVLEVAKKVGKYQEVTKGKTFEEMMEDIFKFLGLQRFISWEELKEKGYYLFPLAPDWEQDPPGLRKFYEDPEANPLPTPSGKLEFYSERLAKYFPDDEERAPIPKWVEKGVTHDERISSKRAKQYPLLLMSNHGRWRTHSQCDDISWTREAPTCKVKGPDGYMYEPVWIHPSDAAKREIRNGNIVKIYNERGAVLAGALVWERIRPGALSIDHGARVDAIIPGKLDRGGAINLISPEGTTSKHCAGQATSGYLVEVEKVSMDEMEEWRKKYPEAFEREYDPASGLRFNAWVEGGM
jgi:molybdopterin guanine dinucleotide-containing S/N-oxide reductase-like protein